MVYAGVGTVVGAFVRANGVDELVFGSVAVGAAVGEEDGCAAQAEEAVGDEHGAVPAKVGIGGHILRGDHQCIAVGMYLYMSFE